MAAEGVVFSLLEQQRLAGTDTVFRNWVWHFEPLTPVPFPSLRLAADVVVLVSHRLSCASSQQPHVVAVSSAPSTHVLSQPENHKRYSYFNPPRIKKNHIKGGNGWKFGHLGQKSLFHVIEQI